ncbi:MAG: recombinase family protein [Mycobacteriales bacterium]|nr:MAG: serine recombinase [Pseudonocardiales bacterium]
MEATAGVYVRISSDVLGEGLGVARQEKECRALAERRGWPVAQVYVDNDLSAFSGKPRPAYRDMLAAIRAGRIGRVIAWHGDRLHRSPLELEEFISLVEATGCQVETVQSGPIDLGNPSGRLHARTVGGFARYESEQKSRRLRSKLEQNAIAGKHHGGTRPFGWDDDRVSLRPDEAAAVRTAASMLLTGSSINAIARTLNEAGITPAGTKQRPGTIWRDSSVRGMLLRARNAGLRVHHGEIIGTGQWTPILDREQWERVRLILTDPARRTTPGAAGRKHLLSAGLALCGVCGAPMRSGRGKAYNGISGKGIYRCQASSCVVRGMATLDGYVTQVLCARLARADAVELLRRDEPAGAVQARADVATLRARLDVAAAGYADGAISVEQMRTITTRLRPRITAAEKLIPAPAPRVQVLDTIIGGDDVRTVWDGLDVSVQRQILQVLLRVVVHRARRGHGGFDPDAIKIEWRTG